MKTYVTFGQNHAHRVNERTFDRDCVAVIHCHSPAEGRRLAFKYFGRQFCFEYPESAFPFDSMRFYPRGLVPVNEPGSNADDPTHAARGGPE